VSIRILFLGTAGAIPTSQRSLPAIILKRGNGSEADDTGKNRFS